jgi:hypothetical protein
MKRSPAPVVSAEAATGRHTDGIRGPSAMPELVSRRGRPRCSPARALSPPTARGRGRRRRWSRRVVARRSDRPPSGTPVRSRGARTVRQAPERADLGGAARASPGSPAACFPQRKSLAIDEGVDPPEDSNFQIHCFGPLSVSPPWSCYRRLSGLIGTHLHSVGSERHRVASPLQGDNRASRDGLADARM